MAQDDEFFIDGRTSKRSGSQGSPKTRTSKGGSSSQPIVKLGNLPGGSMSFTKRLAKDMAIAKRSSGRRTYVKPSKPKTGRFNARGRGRSALAAGIGPNRSWQTFDGSNIRYRSRRAIVKARVILAGPFPGKGSGATGGAAAGAAVATGTGIVTDRLEENR